MLSLALILSIPLSYLSWILYLHRFIPCRSLRHLNVPDHQLDRTAHAAHVQGHMGNMGCVRRIARLHPPAADTGARTRVDIVSVPARAASRVETRRRNYQLVQIGDALAVVYRTHAG